MYAVLFESPTTPSAAITFDANDSDGSMVMAMPPFVGVADGPTAPIRCGLYCSQNVLSPAAASVAGIFTAVTPSSVRSARWMV